MKYMLEAMEKARMVSYMHRSSANSMLHAHDEKIDLEFKF